MSHLTSIITKTVDKVFDKLAKEFSESIDNVQIGFAWDKSGKVVFEAYKNLEWQKQFELSDYLSFMETTVSGSIIEATISQAAQTFCKELGVPIENINVILKYNNGGVPKAVLMTDHKNKIRNVDIGSEFMSSAS